MAVQYKQMKVEELVNEILSGEINFRGIELPQGANLRNYEGFHEMQNYLMNQNPERNPIDLSNSNLIGLSAPTIYLPYSKLEGANLEGANLMGANLWRADLWRADFMRANLEGANLERADLREANLRGADLGGADLERADLERADLGGASLMRADLGGANLERADLDVADLGGAYFGGVKKLEKALNLPTAKFNNTCVTSEEKAILMNAQPLRDTRFNVYP